VLQLVDGLKRVSGVDAKTVFAPHRPGEQQDSFVDSGKASELLGWRPQVGLDRGLALTFEWFQNGAKSRGG
jgi:UDP-glucose 4-epimerase